MKIFLFLAFAGICSFTVKKESKTRYPNEPDKFSKVFDRYASQFDTLLVYSRDTHYFEEENKYRIIGAKKGVWHLIDYSENVYNKSTVETAGTCYNCNEEFNKILKNRLLLLANESELPFNSCKKTKDTVIDGQELRLVNDFEAISDLEVYNLEYKVGKFKKKLTYRSPETALSICPDSKDRKSVQQILSIIKQVTIVPEPIIAKTQHTP